MKAKTFVACALTVVAVPFAPAVAQNAQPSGPQGTGWYGAPNAAVPVPQPVSPAYMYAPQVAAAPAPIQDRSQWEQHRMDERSDMRRPAHRNWVYQGNSFDTNPPAPAQ
jgi:hypothetical protein